MAEYLLRARLGRDAGWTVLSAGVAAACGIPASREAVLVLAELGIDLTPHRSQPLTPELIDEAALLVVMTAAHSDCIKAAFPEATDKVFRLKSFASPSGDGNIADPIGLSTDVYRGIRDEIAASLPGLIAFMKTL